MENALRACCKGIKIGKILIHRVGDNGQQVSIHIMINDFLTGTPSIPKCKVFQVCPNFKSNLSNFDQVCRKNIFTSNQLNTLSRHFMVDLMKLI